jgi:hypothetical protein
VVDARGKLYSGARVSRNMGRAPSALTLLVWAEPKMDLA